jgi:hypothetical protein
MSVIWSGITEEGAIVPVQVDETGKVVATGSGADKYVLKAGDTMTGPLVLSGDPTQDLQAATKGYVDTASGGLGVAAAWGTIDRDGSILSGYNVARVTSGSEGVYIVLFSDPLPNNAYAVLVSTRSALRYIGITSTEPNSFVVEIFNRDDGVRKGNSFFFTVFCSDEQKRVTYTD